MSLQYYEIKDKCRRTLLKYLKEVLDFIPKSADPNMLDLGCGTGVPTFYLLEQKGGRITAVDVNGEPLDFLRSKIQKTDDRIEIRQSSLFDLDESPQKFDVLLAEGLLNVVGFKKGFRKLYSLTKKNGFIIIHDEFPHQIAKVNFIEDNQCKVLSLIEINEEAWWEDYYSCLQKEIMKISDENFLALFESDLNEIAEYKKDPTQFKSIYYLIQKT